MTMASLFDPGTYADVRRPLLEAGTLPPECYTSTDFYQQEVFSIFSEWWNLIGRGDVVKNPGDFFTHTLVGVSLIIMRGEDGKIRAFVNSCRHRGAKILRGEGSCKGIRCPYHSWLYSTLGELRNSNGMQDTLDFSYDDYGLLEVKLDIWCGFLFVNFDPNCISLREYLGDLGDYTHSYEFDSMITVKRREVSLQTNWKNYIQNSMESFHLPTGHHKTIGRTQAEVDAADGHPRNYAIPQPKTN